MADDQAQRIVNFEGKPQVFPADFTDAEISAALGAIPAANAPNAPKAKTWAPIVTAGSAVGVPAMTTAAEQAATNPGVPRAVAAVGRLVGGSAPIVANPTNPMSYLASPGGAWAGGRAGYFGGKMIQSVAAPVAKVIEAVAPYAQTLKTLGGIQTGMDLSVMADNPNRQDVGTLGVSVGEPRSNEEKAAHPALINLAVEKVSDAIKRLMGLGISQGEAVRQVMNASVKNKG